MMHFLKGIYVGILGVGVFSVVYDYTGLEAYYADFWARVFATSVWELWLGVAGSVWAIVSTTRKVHAEYLEDDEWRQGVHKERWDRERKARMERRNSGR